jgi:hypothetical protein
MALLRATAQVSYNLLLTEFSKLYTHCLQVTAHQHQLVHAHRNYYSIARHRCNNCGNVSVLLDILDYANTNKYKTSRSLEVTILTELVIFLTSGLMANTSAINSITITAIGTFNEYSHSPYTELREHNGCNL